MKAYESKAVCKKGWPVLTASGFGGQSGEERGGTSEAREEAGAGPRASYTKLRDPASTETGEAVSGGVLEDVRAAV